MHKKGICLSFDIEEWSIPNTYSNDSKYANSIRFSVEGVNNILNLLEKKNIKSTFFVTGYFAEREPAIVKKIYRKGHEIASHSYKDEDHSRFNEKETFDRINKSKVILGDIIKSGVNGFRMPQFSVNKHLFKVLSNLNFLYDSSVHPAVVPGHYYNIFKKTKPHIVNGDLFEIPISVIPLIKFPISWIWMRNLGNWVTNLGTMLNLLEKKPVILYFHSWEFTKLPKIDIPPYLTKNCGKRFLRQLEEFIETFKAEKFCKLVDLVDNPDHIFLK